jgi:uncharacterized protein YndB with AHSA1/START domain
MKLIGVLLAGILLYALGGRRVIARWRATAADEGKAWPGDELIAAPTTESIRTITIDAPPAQVWPWLVQIGQGRGGFYSYDWLENAIGLDIHSAERIHEEWQGLAVGDAIRLGPQGPTMQVVELVPERALVLRGTDAEGRFPIPAKSPYFDTTWAFILEPVGAGQTRLVMRDQTGAAGAMKAFAYIMELLSFIMEERMLRGVKERAERQK